MNIQKRTYVTYVCILKQELGKDSEKKLKKNYNINTTKTRTIGVLFQLFLHG